MADPESELCVVCLIELEGTGEEQQHPPGLNRPASNSDEITDRMDVEPAAQAGEGSTDTRDAPLIASLVPCMHTLHHACLRPWVEQCNSCPICRQTFNTVNVFLRVGGPILSSYEVEDRTQPNLGADFLPSWVETGPQALEDPDFQICQECEAGDHGEDLLICDGCNMCYHTFCVGLESVPEGDWFCRGCARDHGPREASYPYAVNFSRDSIARRMGLHDTSRRRTDPRNANPWAHTWQLVFNRLNLDMAPQDRPNVPFSRYLRRSEIQTTEEQQRREFRVWQQMFNVAQRQGGRANRFRDTLPLLEQERNFEPPEEPTNVAPQVPEEDRAWQDLDKAQEMAIEEASGNRKRKRKRANQSPEPAAAWKPERKLKRPSTRRASELPPASSQLVSSTSTNVGSSSGLFIPETPQSKQTVGPNTNRPSFLQSIINVVESSTPAPRGSPTAATAPASVPTRPSRRRSSGMATSPLDVANIHSIPRAASSPLTSPTTNPPGERLRTHLSRPESSASNLPRSTAASSPKKELSITAKEGISMMVKTALKPFYHQENGLSTEEYTVVNRNVSRLLYGLVGEATNFDVETKKHWEGVAIEEVQKAVKDLKKK